MTTQERNKASAAIFTAAADGKECEWNSHDKRWVKCDPFARGEYGNVINYPELCRIKPEPVTRPWSKPEDVPGVVCWIGRKDGKNIPGRGGMIITILDEGICAWAGNKTGAIAFFSWDNIRKEKAEYSTDRKTWQPCVVTEAQP